MKSQRITFRGALGDELAARLDLPDGPIVAYALFAHCFTCSKDLKAVTRLSRALTARSIAVCRFDFTGLGESEGDFADTDFSSNQADLEAAIDHLRREHRAPQLLIGHSLGGAAVLAVAADVPECRAVVTLGAPSDTEHLVDSVFGGREPDFDDDGVAEVSIGGRPFRVGRQLLDDLRGQQLLDRVAVLGRPLLILHSPVDSTVGIDHARRIYQAAKHPKSFVSLDQADHLLIRDPADARYAAELIAAWSGRYIAADEGAAGGTVDAGAADEAPRVEGEVWVVGSDGYRQSVGAGRHPLVADEPTSLGGTDEGPNPYEFLLAALGACTNITLRMYADRKQWPLEGVRTRLVHRKVHVRDCEDCETEKGKVDEIEREIELSGPLDEEQLERLMEIADRCPVHRTLHSEIKVRTRRTGRAEAS